MNPQLYGKEHLIYIAVSLITAFLTCLIAKKISKSERAKIAFLKCAAVLLFLTILTNRFTLVFEHDTTNWKLLLPDSFCSASSYVLSLAIIFGKKNNNVLHFIWLIALAGGSIVTFYSDFIDQNPSFMYPPTFLGMAHHTLAAIVVILSFMLGYLSLTYKKCYCTLFGFTCYFAYGAFLYFVLGYSNPFYMAESAINGTPFTAWFIAPIYIAVYSVILLIVELVRKKQQKKLQICQNPRLLSRKI